MAAGRSIDSYASATLERLESQGLRRRLAPTRTLAGHRVVRDGRTLVSFCDNDYLGLAHDPRVIAAARTALESEGAGATGSRLVTGDHPLHAELERAIATLKGTASALVVGSGYLANTGVLPAFAHDGDLVVLDALAHACLHAGARLGGATVRTYSHDDVDALRAVLSRERGLHARCVVATEGVFSMDGDVASLPAIVDVCREFDAWLLVDDAHGLGVLGGGRGTLAELGVEPNDVPLQVGTLSKAAGSAGGFIAASESVTGLMHSRARTLIYSTALPPSVLAASLEAVRIIATEPARCTLPHRQAKRFADQLGLPTPAAAIVPLVLGTPEVALEASRKLEAEGFLVTAIRPPTVPAGTARLRITFAADHTDEDVDALAEAVGRIVGRGVGTKF